MGFLENISRWLRGVPEPSNFSGVLIDVEDTVLDENHIARNQVEDPFSEQTLRKAKLPEWFTNHPYGVPRTDNDYLYRKLAQMGIVQRCIMVVLDEVLDSPWDIVPSDPMDDSDSVKAEATRVKEKLLKINSNESSYFQEWRKALTDYFEVGDGVLVKMFDSSAYTDVNGHKLLLPNTPAGKFEAFQVKAYDSTQFQVFATPYGDILGHFQFNFRASPPRFFTPRETIILQDNPTTYRHYGRSRIKQVKEFLEMVGAQMLQMRNYYQKGGIFQGIVKTTGFAKDERDKVKKFFQSKFRTMAHKIGLIQSTSESATVDFIPLMLSVEDLAFLNGLDFVQRFVASVYGVTPGELGLSGDGSKAGRAEEGRVFRRRTVRTMKHMIEYRTNNEVIAELSPGGTVKFQYDNTPEPEIRRIEQEIAGSQLDRDQITLNEWRSQNGLHPYPEGYGDKPKGLMEQEKKEENAKIMAEKLGGNGSTPPGVPDEGNEMEGREDSDTEPAVSSEEDTEGGDPEKKGEDLDKKAPYLRSHADPVVLATEVLKIVVPLINGSKKDLDAQDVDVFTPDEKPKADIDEECISKNYARIKTNFPDIEDKEALGRALEICALAKHPSDSEKDTKALARQVDLKDISDKEKDKRLDELYTPLEDEIRSNATKLFNEWREQLLNLPLETMSLDDVKRTVEQIVDHGQLAEVIAEELFEAFLTGLKLTDDLELEELGSFNLPDSQAIEYFKSQPLIVAESIAERLENRLRFELRDSITKGISIPKMREKIRSVMGDFTDYESDRLARTEVTNASTWGRINQMRANGRDEWKFYTALDERVCPQCGPLHGNVFDIKDLEFKPPVHPNCRCTVLTTVGDSDTKSAWFPTAEIGKIEFKYKRPIENILTELYVIEDLGYRGVSRELEVSHTTIANWVKMIGIQKQEVEA